MTRVNISKEIYDGTNPAIIAVSGNEVAKFQAKGTGVYTVKGRIETNFPFVTLGIIRVSDYEKSMSASDEEIWTTDISGISAITVEAIGFDSIMAVVLG